MIIILTGLALLWFETLEAVNQGVQEIIFFHYRSFFKEFWVTFDG